jgi:hypothetical protein
MVTRAQETRVTRTRVTIITIMVVNVELKEKRNTHTISLLIESCIPSNNQVKNKRCSQEKTLMYERRP